MKVEHRDDGSFTVTWNDGAVRHYDRVVRSDGTAYHLLRK